MKEFIVLSVIASFFYFFGKKKQNSKLTKLGIGIFVLAFIILIGILTGIIKTEDLPKQMLQDVIRIVRNNGGLEYTKNQANIHAQAAQKCLASLPESQFRHAMKAMVDFSVNRRS